jgi:DNA-binding XRE family transcriptional regulator
MEISPAKRAGRILELLREETGQTQQQVANAVNVSNTTISHLENGTKGAHIDTVTKIGKAIRHERVVAELWGFVGSPDTAATADLLAGYEAAALRISTWTTTVVHALLQTEPYARAVTRASLPFAPDAEVDELVTKRMARQGALARQNPPLLWAVVDESVLYRTHGASREVMHGQLAHLDEQASRPGVVVQVLPFTAAGSPALEGALAVIEFSDKTPIWYSDGWSAGKLSDNRDEVADYARYFDLIRAAALSPVESRQLISEVRSEKYAQ